MADGESVEDQLDDLRTQWIELSDEIAPNISPIGEAPGLIRGKLVDLVEANDADRIGARFRPPAPPVRSDRRGKATIPNRPHLIVIIWHCPARQRRVPRPGLPTDRPPWPPASSAQWCRRTTVWNTRHPHRL